MRIKEEYSLAYDLDGVSIVRTLPGGVRQEICPISETAAMAWEGIERGMDRQTIIDAIAAEFDGADPATVARDLDALVTQLTALGYIEP